MSDGDLHSDVRMLTEIVTALDDHQAEICADFLYTDLIAWAMVEEARRNLAIVSRDMEKKLTKLMPDKQLVVAGAGTFERYKKKARTEWDREALLSAVLDSRLADRDGVLVDETPLEKVLRVWNLPAPRVTALRERHIDADQFCHTEDQGYALRLIS